MKRADPIPEAKRRRERVLEEWRDRVAKLSAEMARARTMAERGPEKERPRAREQHDLLEKLRQRALVEARDQVERACEGVRQAELADLKEDGIRVAKRLESALERLEAAGLALARELAAMRETVDEVNRLLAKARGMAGSAESDARDSRAAARRCGEKTKRYSGSGEAAAARDAQIEQAHWDLVREREENQAREAQAVHDLLAPRKERLLTLLGKLAPGPGRP